MRNSTSDSRRRTRGSSPCTGYSSLPRRWRRASSCCNRLSVSAWFADPFISDQAPHAVPHSPPTPSRESPAFPDSPLQHALLPYVSCPNPALHAVKQPRFLPSASMLVRSSGGQRGLMLVGQDGEKQCSSVGWMFIGTLKPAVSGASGGLPNPQAGWSTCGEPVPLGDAPDSPSTSEMS